MEARLIGLPVLDSIVGIKHNEEAGFQVSVDAVKALLEACTQIGGSLE